MTLPAATTCPECGQRTPTPDLRGHLATVHGWTCCPLCPPHKPTHLDPDQRCCAVCRQRIDDNLRDIVDLGDATAVTAPTRSQGGSSGPSSMESKPPIDLDRAAPYLAIVKVATAPATVSDILGLWERRVREDRGLGWIGNATAAHTGTSEPVLAAKAARASVALLRRHLEWITTHPGFPLADFATEIRLCCRRMRAFDSAQISADRIVECPTLTGRLDADGEPRPCGCRLTIRTYKPVDSRADTGRRDNSIGEPVCCPDCLVSRTPEQLIHAAGKDGAWADPEAIAQWYSVGARTLRRWAAEGHVRRYRGMYSLADVERRRDELKTRAT